jgi:hypothetical protein
MSTLPIHYTVRYEATYRYWRDRMPADTRLIMLAVIAAYLAA